MSHGCVCSTRRGVLRADIAHLFVSRVFAAPHDTVSEIPYTLHPTPYTLHPAPLQFARLRPSCVCCPSWYCEWKFLHPTSHTPPPTPYTLHPTPCTLTICSSSSVVFLLPLMTLWVKILPPTSRGGGLGSSTIFKNLMSPTPRRKWYLTTGRRAH